jgi:2'-5' RNA ligase
MARFFIALMPPAEIQAEAIAIRQEIADRHHRSAAAKSPPHITLQPPFEWPDDRQSELEQVLHTIASQLSAIPIVLHGFGAFAPRVIYIDVVPTSTLLQVQKTLSQQLEIILGIVDPNAKTRCFTPHMTIAYQNLFPKNFEMTWQTLCDRPFHAEFTVPALTLLQHNGHQWQCHSNVPFSSKLSSSEVELANS